MSSHFYDIYLTLHRAHKEAPDIYTVRHCQKILEAAMAVLPGGWLVVGVTPLARQQFAEMEFCYPKKLRKYKIQRAHLLPRRERMQELLHRDL
jgi:hypothetical protein